MREIQVTHMQRSGGHAVGNWIMQQIAAPAVFVNDICHPDRISQWRKERPRIGPNVEWLITGVEDQLLGRIPTLLDKVVSFLPILHDTRPIHLLVLRDIHNMLASRWMFGQRGGKCQLGNVNRDVIKTWVQYARVFFYLSHGAGHRLNLNHVVPVNFNQWATNKAYRETLWRALSKRDDGLPGAFTDAGYEDVTTWGGGSSFDGTSFDGRASQMTVCYRHAQVPADAYQELIDDEARTLSTAIFGEQPLPTTRSRRISCGGNCGKKK